MRKILFGSAMALLMALILSSCSDPEASTLLTDGSWKFKDLTTTHEDQDVIDLINLFKMAHTDATLEFQDGGTYILEYLIGDPETGSWELIGDDLLILTADGTIPLDANIETLTEEKLKYIMIIPEENLGTIPITYTWTR
jgi:hypothetical protein